MQQRVETRASTSAKKKGQERKTGGGKNLNKAQAVARREGRTADPRGWEVAGGKMDTHNEAALDRGNRAASLQETSPQQLNQQDVEVSPATYSRKERDQREGNPEGEPERNPEPKPEQPSQSAMTPLVRARMKHADNLTRTPVQISDEMHSRGLDGLVRDFQRLETAIQSTKH